MVGDAHHWRDQPFYAIPKQLQWQFLERLGEDKFVMQLGALCLHIKDNFLCFELMRNAYLVANSCRNPCCQHPVVYANNVWSKFVHNCKLQVSSLRADEQSTPRELGAYGNMPIYVP